MSTEFITVEEAQAAILADVSVVGAERVMLMDTVGRRLAETILCPEDSPPFDNSAMDGIACRHADLGSAALKLVGVSAAGAPFTKTLSPGEAVRIMTGAVVPNGADTVAVREVCTFDDDSVVVSEAPAFGANIRAKGSSLAAGELTLDVGDKLGPGEISLLASFGRSTVSVCRPPRVAILTTGDELVDVGSPRAEGQIVNSNAYMLRALVEDAGAQAWVLPIVPDDKWETTHAFKTAIQGADIVVSVGGVSVGDFDYVRDVLSSLSSGIAFWKIRMKPGKPLAFGRATADGTPLIGLPGNPVSSFVCFYHFVRPIILMMLAVPETEALLPQFSARLSEDVSSTPKRRHYITGSLSFQDGPIFSPYSDQSSGNLRAIAKINALGMLEEGVSHASAGQQILVHPLPI